MALSQKLVMTAAELSSGFQVTLDHLDAQARRSQVEEGLRGLGFDRLVIYRPGVLWGKGDRSPAPSLSRPSPSLPRSIYPLPSLSSLSLFSCTEK